jgi:hypothetical protein
MSRPFAVLMLAVLLAVPAGTALGAKPTVVSSEAQFQAALDAGATKIVIQKNTTITLTVGLTYSGTSALVIEGNGGTLDASGLQADAFLADGGADVTISDLTVEGGDARGIALDVPSTATGTVALTLKNVVAKGFARFAVHVNDAAGSEASIELDLDRVTLTDNGVYALEGAPLDDQDPLRVDEAGDGDIVATFTRVISEDNRYDGIELDEQGDGGVFAWVVNSSFERNGDGSTDLEDAFDIDEAGDGSIWLEMKNVVMADCEDEGLDLDEEGDGDVVLTLANVTASGCADENVKVTEENGGDLVATFSSVEISDGDGDGLQLEELDAGDFDARFSGCQVTDNGDDGLVLDQLGTGTGTARVTGTKFRGNADDDINPDGVDVTRKP